MADPLIPPSPSVKKVSSIDMMHMSCPSQDAGYTDLQCDFVAKIPRVELILSFEMSSRYWCWLWPLQKTQWNSL